MAKNDKKTKNPPVEAPVVKTPEEKVPAESTTVNTGAAGVPDGMSQHDKVLYGSLLQHRKDEMVRNGVENAEKYQALTMIEDAVLIDVAVTELVIKKNPMSLILTANEKNYEAVKLLASEMGVSLPEFKTLPKPTKEQLAAVGLTDTADKVVLKLEDKNVSKEAKEQKKKEQKIIDESLKKDYLKDLTKIETDEQLKEALAFQLVNPSITNPVERVVTTTQFYRSYLEARAEKSADPKAELEKVHGFTLPDLLQDIITMVPPTFITSVFGQRLGRIAHDANSVVPAFIAFKNCVTDRKTGNVKFSDEEIAAFVRCLIVWYVSEKTASLNNEIKTKEENIKVLKKDAKANAKGIESEEKKIAGLKSTITHFSDMISLVTDPSFEIVDNLVAIYNDKENPNHIYAKAIVKEVLNSYYSDVDIPELEFDTALLNVQQHVGIIYNLFSSELAKRDEYSKDKLIELSVEEKPEEKSEEKPKNS